MESVFSGLLMGLAITTVVFPVFVYCMVLLEMFLRPWRSPQHVHRLRYSWVMSMSMMFSWFIVAGFGVMAWLSAASETDATPDNPGAYSADSLTPAEAKGLWFGLFGAVLFVSVVRRWIRRRAAANPA